jgi:2-polyprenyl-3-methyl-5-hydroxy-6-metoxy-1,4-benzoquinol methylase
LKDRGYQYDFSNQAKNRDSFYQEDIRQKKAKTMVKVISSFTKKDVAQLNLLNVGGSAGIIDEYLSRYFNQVIGMDIDEKAITYASNNFSKNNLIFELGDAMNMQYDTNSFDVIVCSQVYEHVQDAKKMMEEIYRVLKPKGIVYFAAGNRLVYNEPHYDLPLLSVIPRPLAHIYLKLLKKGDYYYEKHFTYWGLKRLVKPFNRYDFTKLILQEPQKYAAEYMIKPNSVKQKLAIFIAKYFKWILPGYIWILEKE